MFRFHFTRKEFLLVVLVLFITLLMSSNSSKATPLQMNELGVAPVGTDWDTHNLSNHALSEGELKHVVTNSIVVGNTVHTVWMETTEIVGDQQTHELFYRSVPFGNTRKVGFSSTSSKDWPNSIYEFDLQAAENGRVCTTFGNKIWCNDYDEPLTFTDRSVVETKLILETNGNIHLVWVENGLSINQREIMYWQEATDTTKLISNYDTNSYILSLETLLDNDTLHIAWAEYDENGIFTPYYWNSLDETAQDVSVPNEEYATNFKLFKVNNDAIHLFWEAEFESEDRCPAHWTAGTSELLFDNQAICGYNFIFQESNGKFFVTWLSRDTNNGYHWNSDLTDPIQMFDSGVDASYIQALIGPDNTFHFLWLNSSESTLSYWNNVDQEILELSAGLSGNIQIYISRFVKTIFSSDGTLHVVWQSGTNNENDLYYWNSADETRSALSAPEFSDGSVSHEQITNPSTNNVQISWYEENRVHSWNNTSLTTTQLATLSEDDKLYELWFAADGSVKAVWSKPEAPASEDDDLFVWEENGAETNLSALAGTNGDINSVSYEDDQKVQVYMNDANEEFIFWAEDTGTTEDEDRFVAHPRVNLPEKVYLPVILR